MADCDYVCKDYNLDPPGPEPDDYIRASCDKCGCAICIGERCFVFVDKADKRTFCDGCLYEFEFEE